jgi:hypothetical protein
MLMIEYKKQKRRKSFAGSKAQRSKHNLLQEDGWKQKKKTHTYKSKHCHQIE